MQRPAVVDVRGRKVVEVEDGHLAAGDGDVTVGRETADAIVNRRCRGGVVDVDDVIAREVGIERDAEQATLAG